MNKRAAARVSLFCARFADVQSDAGGVAPENRHSAHFIVTSGSHELRQKVKTWSYYVAFSNTPKHHATAVYALFVHQYLLGCQFKPVVDYVFKQKNV